jgi:hypothetical protein
MKRILTVVLALALVGYLGCGAYANDMASGSAGSTPAVSSDNASNMGSGMVKEGSQRIAVSGGAAYSTTSGNYDSYDANFMVQGEYGYMVFDQFQLAARVGVELDQAKAGGSQTRLQSYSLVVVPKWCIPVEGNVAPYVGPKAGVAYISDTGSTDAEFIWGAVLGADIFLSKHSTLFVELDYTQFNVGGHDLGGGSYTVKDTGLSVGLAYWW